MKEKRKEKETKIKNKTERKSANNILHSEKAQL